MSAVRTGEWAFENLSEKELSDLEAKRERAEGTSNPWDTSLKGASLLEHQFREELAKQWPRIRHELLVTRQAVQEKMQGAHQEPAVGMSQEDVVVIDPSGKPTPLPHLSNPANVVSASTKQPATTASAPAEATGGIYDGRFPPLRSEAPQSLEEANALVERRYPFAKVPPSLRDRFAMAAAQGMSAAGYYSIPERTWVFSANPENIARRAGWIADAMLAERQKQRKEQSNGQGNDE